MERTAPSATPICPKCSYPVPDRAVDCPACGIVYSKYRPLKEHPTPETPGADADDGPFNPYARPTADLWTVPDASGAVGDGVWRAGKLLVMSKAATLPHRCVRCNLPAQTRLRRKLSWHKPLIYLALLVNLLIYVIIALIARKKAELEIPLCEVHDRSRKTWLAIGAVLLLSSVALVVYGLSGPDLVEFFLFGMLAGLVSLFILALSNQPLRPKKIDDEHLWLTNAAPDYLATLPDAPVYLNL